MVGFNRPVVLDTRDCLLWHVGLHTRGYHRKIYEVRVSERVLEKAAS